VGTTLPLDDVNGNCVELAGRFVVRRPRLLRVVEALQRPAALSDGIELLARVSDSNTWQSGQLQREVPDVLADADTRGDRLMRLPDVRALLARQIAGSPARANFGTGTLTVCAMTWCRRARYRSGWCWAASTTAPTRGSAWSTATTRRLAIRRSTPSARPPTRW
jgi:exodeoxyribonuclease V gamma subunit